MSVQVGFLLLFLVSSISASMHGLPCSSFGHCFGNPSDVNTDPAPSLEPNNSTCSTSNNILSAAEPVLSQPATRLATSQEQQHEQLQRTLSCVSSRSTGSKNLNGTDSNSNCYMRDGDDDPYSESPPPATNLSERSDEEVELECSLELELKYPQIPRPSIIIRQPKVWKLISLFN